MAKNDTPVGDPDAERFDEICRAVGFVTLIWAHIDTLLDCCGVILDQDFGGHPRWAELPRTRLNEKTKLLRACMNDTAALSAFKEEGIAIADEIDSLSGDRHWLVHGASDALTTPGLIRLVRTRLKGEPSIEEKHSSVEHTQAFGCASLEASKRLNQFLLFNLLGLSKDELDQIRRELAV